jgi:hypothetical protein
MIVLEYNMGLVNLIKVSITWVLQGWGWRSSPRWSARERCGDEDLVDNDGQDATTTNLEIHDISCVMIRAFIIDLTYL